MPKTSYISTVLQHIENHLMSSIDPESIAKQHFISLSQLYRDFYALLAAANLTQAERYVGAVDDFINEV
jgi:flagellin-specific chaperone FliS